MISFLDKVNGFDYFSLTDFGVLLLPSLLLMHSQLDRYQKTKYWQRPHLPCETEILEL